MILSLALKNNFHPGGGCWGKFCAPPSTHKSCPKMLRTCMEFWTYQMCPSTWFSEWNQMPSILLEKKLDIVTKIIVLKDKKPCHCKVFVKKRYRALDWNFLLAPKISVYLEYSLFVPPEYCRILSLNFTTLPFMGLFFGENNWPFVWQEWPHVFFVRPISRRPPSLMQMGNMQAQNHENWWLSALRNVIPNSPR